MISRIKTFGERVNGRASSVTVLLLLAVAASAWPALAQQELILANGRNDYEQHCAACHGEQGRGDGRMASILVVPPSDLTEIAKRYNGEFPFWRIYTIIDGSEPVQGHDTFQMPEGRVRFRRSGDWPDARPAYLRVLELTHYLESIQ